MNLSALPLLVAAAFLFSSPARAADAVAGKAKASGMCAVCHGTNGMSQHPEAPNLAGQVEMYLVKAMEEFRGGKRENEMMTVVAKDLTDADIANLAAFYAAIQVTVKDPE